MREENTHFAPPRTQIQNQAILGCIPPGDYPKDAIPPSGKLQQKNYFWHHGGSRTVCHDNSVDILWTVRGATAFLHANGLNTEAISNVLECASNCKNLAQLEASMDLNPQQYDEIQRERESNPHLFQRWKFPSIWMWGCSLHQHVDVSMHLLFLGIMKSVIQMVQEWTILCRRIGSFLKYAGKALEYVQMLGLDWCKIIPYSSDKLGGWVSENYMSIGRLCCWFYASLEQLALDQILKNQLCIW